MQKIIIPEKEVQKVIRQWLELHKWTVYRIIIPRYSKGQGLPDLFALKGDTMIWLEIKSPTTYYKATKEQIDFLDTIRQVKTIKSAVVRSVEEVEKILNV